jgi:hypothetical protein
MPNTIPSPTVPTELRFHGSQLIIAAWSARGQGMTAWGRLSVTGDDNPGVSVAYTQRFESSYNAMMHALVGHLKYNGVDTNQFPRDAISFFQHIGQLCWDLSAILDPGNADPTRVYELLNKALNQFEEFAYYNGYTGIFASAHIIELGSRAVTVQTR